MNRARDREKRLEREWVMRDEKPRVAPPPEPFDLKKVLADAKKGRLNLDQFRAAVRAGTFRVIRLVSGGGHFRIVGELRNVRVNFGERETCFTLGTTRGSKDRLFRSPAGALVLLRGIKVKTVEVELGGWRPELAKDLLRKRPDMAERLRRAHAMALREGGEVSEEDGMMAAHE
jgi:hypothetical protein